MNRRQYERAIRDMVWLPVFDRRLRPIGYETSMQAGSDPTCAAAQHGRPAELAAQFLFRLRLHALTRPHADVGRQLQLYLNLSKAVLGEPEVVGLLFEAALDLRACGYRLNVVATAAPYAAHGGAQRYINALIRLQQADIAVVLADPDLSGVPPELELGLCRAVKLSMAHLEVGAGFRSAFLLSRYETLRSLLYAIVERHRAELWASNVATAWQQRVVSGLPFALGQGAYWAGSGTEAYQAAG